MSAGSLEFEPLTESTRDLGFGSVVSSRRNLRLLNRDGSFNVSRFESGGWRSLFDYQHLLTMSWPRFLVMMLAAVFVLGLLFASGYYALGDGLRGEMDVPPFLRAFYFSIDVLTTIGFGYVQPVGSAANVLVALEAFCGWSTFAMITGLLFARFSRPTAKILYSRNAVIAPYRGQRAFEFRIVNQRRSELIDVHARIVLSRFEQKDGVRARAYYTLNLERDRVAFFPLSWTIVHPIDESSPLHGWDRQRLIDSEAEFLVLLTGVDDTFSQAVHSRSSYAAHEVIWDARFVPMFQEQSGQLRIDRARLHAVEAK